ncbi:MAG: protease inhibitor I9 family protein, partial [Myxococcota bacterium]
MQLKLRVVGAAWAVAVVGCGAPLESDMESRPIEPKPWRTRVERRLQSEGFQPVAQARLRGPELAGRPGLVRLDGEDASVAKLLYMERSLEDRWIVALHDKYRGRVRSLLSTLEEQYPIERLFVYEAALPGFAAKMDLAVVQEILRHPAVRFIEQDSIVEAV